MQSGVAPWGEVASNHPVVLAAESEVTAVGELWVALVGRAAWGVAS